MDMDRFKACQTQLRDNLEALYHSVVGKVTEGQQMAPNLMEDQMTKWRADLDKQVEHVHLVVGNYAGCCTNRKAEIEKAISRSLDVQGFGDIGDALIASGSYTAF